MTPGPPPRLPALDFASCYLYLPCGTRTAAVRSRRLCALVKAGDPRTIARYAVKVERQVTCTPALSRFFGSIDLIVPVPGSTPEPAGRPSVTSRLAAALVDQGLAREAWTALRRSGAVRKSATAAAGARPTVAKHYETILADRGADRGDPADIILVDDVVTKGRTLLAAAMRLREVFPNSRIRAFALFRTMGFDAELDHVAEPCVGEIIWRDGDAHRLP
jgi:predicted amidophosphoribosyltransferase